MRYSDIVMDHFMNPRNMGTITNPDGVGRIGDAACGDVIEVWIKVKDHPDLVDRVKGGATPGSPAIVRIRVSLVRLR